MNADGLREDGKVVEAIRRNARTDPLCAAAADRLRIDPERRELVVAELIDTLVEERRCLVAGRSR